jgi:hypothetical protein
MRRVEVELGMRVGFWVGLAFGIVVGIKAALGVLEVGFAAGLVTAGGIASAGLLVGAAGVSCYNRVAELMDPQIIPPDGPRADYHDIAVPDVPPDRRD